MPQPEAVKVDQRSNPAQAENQPDINFTFR
jgi:hypothetical protein